MTIGISTISDESVIFVADGREMYFSNRQINTDDKNKIYQIEESIALITIGISNITEKVVEILKNNTNENLSIEQFCEKVDLSLKRAWDDFWSARPEEVNSNNNLMQVVLLVGGIIGEETFLYRFARRHDSVEIKKYNTGEFIVSCTDKVAAAFNLNLKLTVNRVELYPPADVTESNMRFIKASAETIRRAEETDKTIGGTIRYLIIQRGILFETKIYAES